MASIGSSVVGVSGGMVSVCQSLSSQASSIEGYIQELDNLKNQLANDWEGDDLDNLLAEFEGFKQKLNELPTVIQSIADWGLSTNDAYTTSAQNTSAAISAIFS